MRNENTNRHLYSEASNYVKKEETEQWCNKPFVFQNPRIIKKAAVLLKDTLQTIFPSEVQNSSLKCSILSSSPELVAGNTLGRCGRLGVPPDA